MPDIVFPPTSAPGLRPQESGGRLINAFSEKAPVGAPSQVIIRRSPGLLRQSLNTIGARTRGFMDGGDVAFWAVKNRLLSFDAGFGLNNIGLLTGSQSVTFARNNALTPDFVAVTEDGCFSIFPDSAPVAYTDADLPASPSSVCDFDGYFIWSFGDGRIFASNLNSTEVDDQSFTTEQNLFIRRVVRFAGNLFAFGDKWTGVYHDAGTQPFPLARDVTIPRGIVGTHAIAGWETGWSNELIWVGDDFVVYQLNGYTPTPISTDDVSRDVAAAVGAGQRALIEAYVYMFENNAFWVLTCPDRFTWEYNLPTGEWNERSSHNRASWKGMKSIRIFDNWIIGDQYTGELYTVRGDYFLEGVDPLVFQAESGIIASFPRGIVIPRASFFITPGVGTYGAPLGAADPVVEISWSLDGGASYGYPVIRRMGMAGETNSHPYVLGSGLSRGLGVRYRLRVSDPVHVGLSGGTIEQPDGRGFAG